MSSVLQFWIFQEDILDELLEAHCRVQVSLLNACVSSGKTAMELALVALQMERGVISHGLFLAPQVIILDQARSLVHERFPDGLRFHGVVHPWPKLDVYDANPLDRSKITTQKSLNRLVDYLGSENSERALLAITYNTYRCDNSHNFNGHVKPKLQLLGDRLFIVVDEAHHIHEVEYVGEKSAGNCTSQRIDAARKAGVRLSLASGTAQRDDKRVVPGDYVISRPLLANMIEGPPGASYTFSPSNVEYGIIELNGESRNLGYSDNETVGVSDDVVEAVNQIVAAWLAEGRPYCIVRAPSGRASYNKHLRTEMKRAFIEAGASYFDASGDESDGISDLEKYREFMRNENSGRISREDIPEVIFTIQRGIEGANSPTRSHLFLIGCPYSIPLLEQLVGRIMRCKYGIRDKDGVDWYPDKWKDTAKVFFALSRKNNEDRVAAAILKASCFFASLAIAPALGRLRGMTHGLSSRTRKRIIDEFGDKELLKKIHKIMLRAESMWKKAAHPMSDWPTSNQWAILMELIAKDKGYNIPIKDIKVCLALLKNNGPDARMPRGPFDSDEEAFETLLIGLVRSFEQRQYVCENKFCVSGHEHLMWAHRVRETLEERLPATLDQISDGVRMFIEKEHRIPRMRDDDPITGLNFGSLDLRMGSDKGALFYPGGFRRFVVDKFSTSPHWTDALAQVEMDRRERPNPISASNLRERKKPDTYPEYVHYKRNIGVMARFPELARKLDVDQAYKLACLDLDQVAQEIERIGEQEFLETL